MGFFLAYVTPSIYYDICRDVSVRYVFKRMRTTHLAELSESCIEMLCVKALSTVVSLYVYFSFSHFILAPPKEEDKE